MLVKLIQNQAHAVHEAVHVGWFAFGVPRPWMGSKSELECFEILHPLESKIVGLGVRFVKYKDEW